MEADRWKSLAVAAQASGRLDFRDADSTSVKWLLKERLILDEIERQRLVDISTTRCLMNAAAVGAANKELYGHHFKQAVKHADAITSLLLPYLDKTRQQSTGASGIGDTPEEMRKSWIKVFGDPDDPKVAESIKKVVAELAKMRTGGDSTAAKETPSRIKVRTKVNRQTNR